MGMIFHEIFVRPLLNILVVIYHGFLFAHIPYALGFSIIALTILIRFILYPVITSQLKASMKMQKLSPHLSKLKEKHKGDATRIQKETMLLYKEHGVNPVAGCLPSLLQLPIIWALYSVLQETVGLAPGNIVAKINSEVYVPMLKLVTPWDQSFFGLPLGQNPSHLIGGMPLILLVPVLTGVFQFIQSKMMFSKPVEEKVESGKLPASPSLAESRRARGEKVEKEGKKEADFASMFQSQALYIFPAMIGFFSYNYPIGLSLYWNTFTIFGILQQYRVSGLGGLQAWKEKLWMSKKKKQ